MKSLANFKFSNCNSFYLNVTTLQAHSLTIEKYKHSTENCYMYTNFPQHGRPNFHIDTSLRKICGSFYWDQHHFLKTRENVCWSRSAVLSYHFIQKERHLNWIDGKTLPLNAGKKTQRYSVELFLVAQPCSWKRPVIFQQFLVLFKNPKEWPYICQLYGIQYQQFNMCGWFIHLQNVCTFVKMFIKKMLNLKQRASLLKPEPRWIYILQ